jgi:hypothetical protein
MVVTMRRYWLVACAAQVGIFASLGCEGLDTRVLPVETTINGSPNGSPTSPPITQKPGQDAGAVTPGGSMDAWIAFDSDGGAFNRDIYVIRADGTGRQCSTAATSVKSPMA